MCANHNYLVRRSLAPASNLEERVTLGLRQGCTGLPPLVCVCVSSPYLFLPAFTFELLGWWAISPRFRSDVAPLPFLLFSLSRQKLATMRGGNLFSWKMDMLMNWYFSFDVVRRWRTSRNCWCYDRSYWLWRRKVFYPGDFFPLSFTYFEIFFHICKFPTFNFSIMIVIVACRI